jgi:hypothetical protein
MTRAVIQTKVIIPSDLDPQWILAELEKEMTKFVNKVNAAYLQTVSTWTTPAKFSKSVTVTKSEMRGFSGTNDKRYLWTDEGTKRYTIVPKSSNKSGRLWFQEGYTAKTRPGQIGSFAGGRFGPVVSARSVEHQTEARNFTKTIKAKLEPRFYKDMARARDRGVKRAQDEMSKRAKGP